MTFDYTRGQKANYLVHIYTWNLNDKLYNHAFKEAKHHYDELVAEEWEEGTIISLSDLNKDVRKAYKRF